MYRKYGILTALLILGTCLITSVAAEGELETAVIQCGTVDVTVEIAADEKARIAGLMHRESLPEGRGMLFVYPKKAIFTLWMKNTLIPLSAAFIDEDGRILQIIQMEKVDSAKIYRSEEKAKYALEVPLGWFRKNSVQAGDYCIIPEIPAQ